MKHRSILERGRITQELSVDFLQRMSENVAREWEEKQARLVKQRDENRKRLFPELWKKEAVARANEPTAKAQS